MITLYFSSILSLITFNLILSGGIWGFAWEADECARQIRDGKTESERMPLNQTLLMMETFDEIRKQGQLIYPESIETTEF